MLGWVLEERVCLLNSIWFRWPIPSSMIDESLGTSFQLDLISAFFFIIIIIVIVIQYNLAMLCQFNFG
jgi:hypothetical protein